MMTDVIKEIVCVIDGWKVKFKEKQSFTLFCRAFVNIIIQRSGRSKSGERKENEKGTEQFWTSHIVLFLIAIKTHNCYKYIY